MLHAPVALSLFLACWPPGLSKTGNSSATSRTPPTSRSGPHSGLPENLPGDYACMY